MSQETRLRWPTPILFYAGETLQIVSAGLVSGFIFGNDAGPRVTPADYVVPYFGITAGPQNALSGARVR